MLREKNPETGKLRFTNLAKGVAGGIIFLVTVGGAIIAIEDRYLSEAEARSKFKAIETQNVSTFEQYQKGLRMEQMVIQKSREMQLLEDYYDHRLFLQDAIKRRPTDTLLEDRLKRLEIKIKSLEKKIYQ